jgi:hypothetical protein
VQTAEGGRLYPDGWSLARLAERYGVDDMTLRRYLLLAGVVIRPPHERQVVIVWRFNLARLFEIQLI